MKYTFYFPHDCNARGDEKIIPLLRSMGPEGYGIYWLIVEKLYEANGRLAADFDLIAWDLKTDSKKIKQVISDFGLFSISRGKIISKSVNRRLKERKTRISAAREKGIASGRARRENSELRFNSGSTEPELERKEIKKEKKEKKEITTAPLAVDLSNVRINLGEKYPNVYVTNIPADECLFLLQNTPRLSKQYREALEWRVALKKSEANGMSKEARAVQP